MQPSEYSATVAVDAAARASHEVYLKALSELPPGTLPPGAEPPPAYDDLDPLRKNQIREAVLPLVWAALSALEPEYGRRIKDDSMGNGHMIGLISSLYRTLEEARAGGNGLGVFGDQEIVVRQVTGWRTVE